MALLATFCGLRLGELLALRRDRVDLSNERLAVTEQIVELTDGTRSVGPPKTEAGRRVVAIPPHLVQDIHLHLDQWVGAANDSLLFTAPNGSVVRRGNFRQREWIVAAKKVGLSNLRLHDLRHTGNTLAASTGASTKELMARMGHSSPRAALIYQHATEERDVAIAKALSAMVFKQRKTGPTTSDPVARTSDSISGQEG
jgi:integrase